MAVKSKCSQNEAMGKTRKRNRNSWKSFVSWHVDPYAYANNVMC